MQNRIPVISSDGQPLVPCRPERAKQLVAQGKAVKQWRNGVYHIQLTRRAHADSVVPWQYELNIDPGTGTTGYAVTRTFPDGHRIPVALLAREHNCHAISQQLGKRSTRRRTRRGRRHYRKPTGLNRHKPPGWLPPSILHLLLEHCRMIDTLANLFPIGLIRIETGVFDPALMDNPDLRGVEYQQGTLSGWQLRAFIFFRDGNRCAYCGKADGRLELDHIIPKSQGGPSRPGNLIASCRQCNRRKGNQDLEQFLQKDPERAHRILKRANSKSYRSATHMNVVMPRILEHAVATGIPVMETDAARTSWNRQWHGVAKAHAHDAALLGDDFTSIGILPEKVAVLRTAPKPRKRKITPDGKGTPRGRRYREYCRWSRRKQSKTPTPGHAGKRKRYGPRNIATGDIVAIDHPEAGWTKGIAVLMPSSGRLYLHGHHPALTASISKATLICRRPPIYCRYESPS